MLVVDDHKFLRVKVRSMCSVTVLWIAREHDFVAHEENCSCAPYVDCTDDSQNAFLLATLITKIYPLLAPA